MNKTGINAYSILLAALMSMSMRMEAGNSSSSSSSASRDLDEEGIFTLEIPTAINALGLRFYQEHLAGGKEDPILLSPFTDLIQAKHAKKYPYMLARTIEQVEDGAIVHHFDVHALNKALFGNYPLDNLRNLSNYKNPVSNLQMQRLEYYECEPQGKVFKFMCSYAALCSQNQNKRMFWLGRLYANQECDLSLAAVAKCNLGVMYENGRGVAVDHAKACELYEEVVNQKDSLRDAAFAKLNLGVMYADGKGVPVDYEKAYELYKEVANQKDNLTAAASAKLNLGLMYTDGKSVSVDYEKAYELYKEVADQKDDLGVAACAKCNLGLMYGNGKGVPVDYEKAYELYKEVADQKDDLGVAACAKCNLGLMCERGKGVPVDYEKAYELYKEVANQKDDLSLAAATKLSLEALEKVMKK